MISNIPPPWNFKLSVHKGKMKSRVPPPWNFNLIQDVQAGRMISTFPCSIRMRTPMGLQTDLACSQGQEEIMIPTKLEFHNDMECPQG